MRPVIKAFLYDDEGKFFGEGPFHLLKGIEETGSLRASAQKMNMSYTKALAMIKRAESVLGFPLTERTIGGIGGGGSRLTDDTKRFLEKYERYRLACEESSRQIYRQIFGATRSIKVGCIFMASGMGKRFGSNKLLADFLGKPMIQHILDKTAGELFAARVVVTRHEEVASLCREQGIQVVLHDLPNRNDTIRLGLEALCTDETNLDGCMFCPCDQPLLTEASLHRLLDAFECDPHLIYRLNYKDSVGSPVIFPCSDFGQLMCLPEKNGGSAVIKSAPDRVRCISALSAHELMDADTQEELEQLRQACLKGI